MPGEPGSTGGEAHQYQAYLIRRNISFIAALPIEKQGFTISLPSGS